MDPESLTAGFNPILVSPHPQLLQPWEPQELSSHAWSRTPHPEHPLCSRTVKATTCGLGFAVLNGCDTFQCLDNICATICSAAHAEMFVSHMLALKAVTPASQLNTLCFCILQVTHMLLVLSIYHSIRKKNLKIPRFQLHPVQADRVEFKAWITK